MKNSQLIRNMAGIAFALLLLVPVPALGLTFLGSWNFFNATTPSGPDSVNGTFQNFTDNPNNYELKIGMGNVLVPSSSVTKYSVTATRDFQITDPTQFVKISHSFGSTIQNAGITVTISIQRYGVANDPFNFPPYSQSAGNISQFVYLDNFFSQRKLTLGLYRLSLTITYNRTPPGTWNNSSPHTFNFFGL